MKTPLGQKLEAGFALPIAAGVGFVMILIATTMVIQSSQSRVASISQRSNHKSLAAAETGVAQYMAFLNQYRGFLTSNLEDWNGKRLELEFRQRKSCSTGGATPDPDYINGDFTKYLPPPEEPAEEPAEELAEELAEEPAEVDNPWISIDESTPDKGRFRIVNYEVDPNLTFGTMTLEGSDEDSTSALTRLEVSFPFDANPVPPVGAGLPPRTGCPFAAIELPINQSLNDFVRNNFVDALNQSFLEHDEPPKPSLTISGSTTLPRSVDPDFENYIYVMTGNPAVNLRSGETLTIEDGKTVFLVTEGDINVNEGQIRLGTDSKLFIISAANVTLTQKADADRPVVFSEEVAQPAASEAFQIFLTGIDPNPSDSQGKLTINVAATSYPADPPANETTLSFVAYAPDGSVRLNNKSDSETSFTGAVWAKNFSLTSDSPSPPPVFTPRNVNPPNIPLFWQVRLDPSQISKRLSSINSWKKVELP